MIGYGIGKLFLNYTAILNFDLGTSRAVNSNENTQGTENTNKHILVAAGKCNIILNFPNLDISCSTVRKAEFKKNPFP